MNVIYEKKPGLHLRHQYAGPRGGKLTYRSKLIKGDICNEIFG